MRSYEWSWLDKFAAACTLGLSIYLLYYADDECSSSQPSDQNFVGTQVTILNRTCKDKTWLFVAILVLSVSVQWVRGIIQWELNQEARVILVRDMDNRPWSYRFHYHRLSILSSLLYILSVVLIIAQNLWVFLALAVGYEISIYRYLRFSPSDHLRTEDHGGADHTRGKGAVYGVIIPTLHF